MREHLISSFRRRTPVLAAWLASASLAFAQSADPGKIEPPARPDYLPGAPGRPFELPPVPAAPAAAATGGPTVSAKRILFRGNAVIASGELEAVAAPYTGRRLDAAELEELRQRLTRHYVERGYVNSGALLGPNAIGEDGVTFDIVEGRLSALRISGLERLDDDYVARRLIRDSDVALNVDTLRERFQLLLDDPLFDRMNARLMPDTKLGEAILDIEVARARPYQLTVFANNYRPPSIGANAYGLSGWVRNLTGYGDVLDATAQDSSQAAGGTRTGVGWRMPVNASGTLLSLQYDHGRSTVLEEPMQALDIRSTLTSREVGLSQVLFESLRHKLVLGVNRVERENRTTLLGQPFSFTPGEPDGVTRVSAWRFWQEYAYRSERQVLAVRSTLTSARNNLQDLAGLPPGAPEGEHGYRLWLGQAQYARQVLENGAQFIVRANVQTTAHGLLALDRMSIGGVGTVRGYRENQLIRDKGTVLNLEFDLPVVRNQGKGLAVNLIPFYDQGRGKNRGEAPATLSSWGVASRLRWQGFSVDLALAKRLVHPETAAGGGDTLQDKGIHLQLSYSFF